MRHLAVALGKGLGLVLVGGLSGLLAMAARRKREPEQLLVKVWTQKPGESSVISETLVTKINGVWVNSEDGYSVHELRIQKE